MREDKWCVECKQWFEIKWRESLRETERKKY